MGPACFPLRWAGRDHTDAVGLHVACFRADDGDGNVSIVNTGEREGRNNECGAEREEEGGREGRRRRKTGQLVP